MKTARGRLAESGQGENLARVVVELHCTFESLSSLQAMPVPEILTQGTQEGSVDSQAAPGGSPTPWEVLFLQLPGVFTP